MNSSVSLKRVLQLVGGGAMVVSSFLEWASGTVAGVTAEGTLTATPATANGWDVGMLGLWQTIIGVLIAVIGLLGLTNRARLLPDEVFGFNFAHATVLLAFPVMLWNFGLQFDEVYGGIGLFIGWVAAAIAIAGTELEPST